MTVEKAADSSPRKPRFTVTGSSVTAAAEAPGGIATEFRYVVYGADAGIPGDDAWGEWRRLHDGRGRLELPGFEAGPYLIQAQGRDAAGDIGPSSAAVAFDVDLPSPVFSVGLTRGDALSSWELGEALRLGRSSKAEAYLHLGGAVDVGVSAAYEDFVNEADTEEAGLSITSVTGIVRERVYHGRRLSIYLYEGVGVRDFRFDGASGFADATREMLEVGMSVEYLLRSLDSGHNISLMLRTGVSYSFPGEDYSSLVWTPPVAFGVNYAWAR